MSTLRLCAGIILRVAFSDQPSRSQQYRRLLADNEGRLVEREVSCGGVERVVLR